MDSTTTQILFNSPALHSLKRDQLVKLCKIHSIKANGKNVEMIQRLRVHAQTLPKDSPLSIAARSEPSGPIPLVPPEGNDAMDLDEIPGDEDEEMPFVGSSRPRPSEQWEVVMDSIEEVEETSSQGTLGSQRTLNGGTGEFGTGGSRSNTVGSSIKALASSLGLKRSMPSASSKASSGGSTSSKDLKATASTSQLRLDVPETDDLLSQTSKPYASLPPPTSLPQTDHFTLASGRTSLGSTHGDGGSPLPGHALRPGVPAPQNARLSLGLGVPATPTRRSQPTTTIRLVSNPLDEDTDGNSGLGGFGTGYTFGFGSGFAGGGENGTPQLKPFKTAFDITFGSPRRESGVGVGSSEIGLGFGFGSLSTWPKPDNGDAVYPKLTTEDMPPTIGDLVSSKPSSPVAASTYPEPFIFGSPNPQHNVSNTQFRSAAASVLEEMNARLRAEGVDEIGLDIVKRLHSPGSAAAAAKAKEKEGRAMKGMPSSPLRAGKRTGAGEMKAKFDVAHRGEFEKMEGIDGAVKRMESLRERTRSQAGKPSPTVVTAAATSAAASVAPAPVAGKKRKSSVFDGEAAGPRKPTAPRQSMANKTRVISNGRRGKFIPGGFGMDDDDDEEDEAPASSPTEAGPAKRPRVSQLSPEEKAKEDAEEAEREKERQRLEKEREAIKKKLDANRARRRSSAAHGLAGAPGVGPRKSGAGPRKSVGPRPSLLTKPKPKPSRFGFLSSAKSFVSGVWNRGKAPAAAAPPSGIPKPISKAEPSATPASGTSSAKRKEASTSPTTKSAATSSMPPPSSIPKKAQASTAATTTNNSSITKSTVTSTNRSRSRSPLPPAFGSSARSRQDSLQSNNALHPPSTRSSIASGTSNAPPASSFGMRSGLRSPTGMSGSRATTRSSTSGIGGVGSMGARTSTAGATGVGTAGTRTSRVSTTSSRLLAPTASSLAKMAVTLHAGSSPSVSGKKDVENVNTTASPAGDKDKQKQALGSITNTTATAKPTNKASPEKGKIFSKPLVLPTAPTTRPTSGMDDSKAESGDTKPTRTASGRKPRISRSKVIARLASKRIASGGSIASVASTSSVASSSSGVGLKPRASATGVVNANAPGVTPKSRRLGGKTRSSLGAKVSAGRASLGGVGMTGPSTTGSNANAVAMALKRKARQSEYMRRRSRVGTDEPEWGGISDEQSGASSTNNGDGLRGGMEVDVAA